MFTSSEIAVEEIALQLLIGSSIITSYEIAKIESIIGIFVAHTTALNCDIKLLILEIIAYYITTENFIIESILETGFKTPISIGNNTISASSQRQNIISRSNYAIFCAICYENCFISRNSSFKFSLNGVCNIAVNRYCSSADGYFKGSVRNNSLEVFIIVKTETIGCLLYTSRCV